ncbi:hypothetical protein D8B23_12455 [Verminephrobacter aporrectodeae subsp. tuberculatae]|uniref:Uncharacterized protein n=1 Tax=Verminephrobacter aporrectodeae subsp. tuberculatae TaxID=1110392 RepID=A0ABT3KYX5_9BURK|nr:hypothetical protein [Verminephrobacter aporrectodeae subsp. tuberculatae]MCW8199215.1 hypothetical protein [Verminephrobacter aporrectodeae subsp. tuberculatae]
MATYTHRQPFILIGVLLPLPPPNPPEPAPAPELPGPSPLPGQELLLTENHEVDASQSDCVPVAHWKSQLTFRVLL